MAENIDGALAFKSTLDNVDFDKNIAELERRIRSASNVAVTEGERMESAFKGVGTAIGAYFSFSAIQGFTSQIIKVRSEFQNTEASFRVFLGSAEKAKNFMDEIQGYAFNNVFEFKDLTKVSAQLLAYGHDVNSIIPIIDKLSNVAAGANVPLEQLASLYNKAKSQGKLMTDDIQQWQRAGVPVIQELAKAFNVAEDAMWEMVTTGKIGFNEIDQVINKLTSNGGMFAGMMTEKMKTLGDSVGLLQDSLTAMFNEIGEKNEDFLRGGILAVNSLVENYEDVIRVLKSIAIAYGTYRAAVVLNTLVTKNQTGVALIDNTVRKAKIALLKAEAVATGQTAAIQAKMTAAEVAHTAALQAKLTVEEQEVILNNLRIAAIQSLLTVEQQQYLTNMNLTTSSEGYVAAAMGVLSVDQKQALNKMDLTRNSQVYAAAISKEVATKELNKAATLDVMRTEVKAAAVKVASAKEAAIVSMQAVEAARYEVYWAKQSGDATRIQAAEKRQLAAVENQSLARKAALAAQTDFYTKKKTLEAAATRQTAAASAADAASKVGQTTVTNLLSVATTKATLAVKTLWTALKTNPLGWILTIVGLAVSAFTMFSKKQEESTDVAKEFEAQIRKETNSIQTLVGVIKSANEGTKVRKEAIEKLNSILNSYNLELLKESATVEEVSKKYDELTKAIKASTAERLKAQGLEKLDLKKESDQEKLTEKFKKDIGGIRNYETKYGGTAGTYTQVSIPKWVQEMDEQIYEFLSIHISQKAEEIAKLTGVEYQKAYQELRQNTIKTLAATTGATETELLKANKFIDKYLDGFINTAKVAGAGAEELKEKLDSAGAIWVDASENIVAETNYATMSLTELDKKAAELERQINSMKLTPGYDPTELNQLIADLGLVRSTISGKELNLKTEAGLDRRIKQLKELKENAEIGGEEYKRLEKQITALEGRKPKTTKQQDEVLKKQQEATQKQIDAALKLEESRIEIMQEGYDKRVAEVNFQHKRTIAAINKEQEELEKAYKDAGQQMPDSEKAGFDERRVNAEKALTISVNNLFDSELDYKRKQYALYFKWVESVGEAAAKEQFKDLLKNGTSYTAYIKAQRDALRDKLKSDGELSESDSKQLITFDAQYNELTGATSAIDRFKEGLTQSVEQAGSLGEKLAAIAKMKEKLEEGDTGIIGDEKIEAKLFIDENEESVNKEIQKRILNDFKTFEERKNNIRSEYAALRLNEQVKDNQELLNRIGEGEKEALSALDAEMLMQSENWKSLFTDLDSLTVKEISRLVKDIQSQISNTDLKLSPVDYKAVIDSLDQAKDAIAQRNPFQAIGIYLNEYVASWKNLDAAKKQAVDFAKAVEESQEAVKRSVQDVAAANLNLQAAKDSGDEGRVNEAETELAEASENLAEARRLLSQAILNEKGNTDSIKNLEKTTREVAKGVADSISSITDVVGTVGNSVTDLFSSFGEEEIAEGIGTAVDLMGELGKTAGGVGKIMSGDIIGGISDIITGLASVVTIFNQIHDKKYEKQIQNLQKEVDGLSAEYDKLGKAADKAYSTDKADLLQQQNDNLQKQNEAIQKQIEAEQEKKKSDGAKVEEWQKQIDANNEQIAENAKYNMVEAIMGTDMKSAIDQFAQAYADAWAAGEKAAGKSAKVVKNLIKTAIIDMLKGKLQPEVEAFMALLSDALADGVIDDAEQRMIDEWERKLEALADKTLKGTEKWLQDDPNEAAAGDALTGAVKGVTEETASILAGRINQIVIYQADGLQIMRQSLIYQSEIAANTRNIAVTNETLRRIENKLDNNSLLSQGIGG